MKLMDYIRAAFNARPIGMIVPPNWLGLAAFAILGLLNPGFWLLGAGLEMGYLYSLVHNSRFRRYVDATSVDQSQAAWRNRLGDLLSSLEPKDQAKFRLLETRCQAILQQQQKEGASAGLTAQGQGLGRLTWIYLRLLLTRQGLQRVLRESAGRDTDNRPMDEQIKKLQARLEGAKLSEELRRSLTGQVEILQQRLAGQGQAKEKLDFVEAELTRIQEQVELIREQAALMTDPMAVSQRIDQVAATLGGTTQWVREQQQIYGQTQDLLVEPPPMVIPSQPQKQAE